MRRGLGLVETMAEAAGDDIKQSRAWLLKTKFAVEVSRVIRFYSIEEGVVQSHNTALLRWVPRG